MNNNWGLAIVITVANASDIIYLCAKSLKFRRALKVMEKYWEVGLGFVYSVCYDISHDCSGNCGDRLVKCNLCAGSNKLEEPKYKMKDCWVE